MRYCEHRAPFGKALKALLNKALAFIVKGRGRFVKNKHRRVFKKNPGDGNPLFLPAGKFYSAFPYIGFIALIQFADKFVGARKFSRLDNFVIGRIRFAVKNVVVNRTGKKINILLNNADAAAQALKSDFAYIPSVKQHFALRNIIESGDKVGKGGLSAAGRTHKGYIVAGVNVQIYF